MRVGNHDGLAFSCLQAAKDLLEDTQRLVALIETHANTVVRVIRVIGGNIEFEILVTAVRLILTKVLGQAGCSQGRTSQAQGHHC